MREWVVASGIIESRDGLLLVQNRRRNGRLDWSTPGGVVEVASGESVLEGLTREVLEETGIAVTRWTGPLYDVEVVAQGLGWHLRVEVHRAIEFSGDLRVEDVDDIVVDACFVPSDCCHSHLESCPVWVREPLVAWLEQRWDATRSWRYRLDGTAPTSIEVVRV